MRGMNAEMRNEYLDRNGRTIQRMDILMNELGELMLVVDNGDDLGINASRPSYIERTSCKEVYPLSNFGGQALMDMKYHLREWEVVGVGGKLNCHKCGSWLAVPHEAYPMPLLCRGRKCPKTDGWHLSVYKGQKKRRDSGAFSFHHLIGCRKASRLTALLQGRPSIKYQ